MLQKAGVRIGTGPHALHRGRVMGNGDLNSWQACALRVLFKPSRALARGECQAIREQYTSPRAEGPSLGTEEVPHRMNAFPSALTPEGGPAWRPPKWPESSGGVSVVLNTIWVNFNRHGGAGSRLKIVEFGLRCPIQY